VAVPKSCDYPPMDMVVTIRFDVETGDDDVDHQILDIAEEEGRKFAAVLSDRLEAEGIRNIKIRVRAV
jgi:hypothetical protein